MVDERRNSGTAPKDNYDEFHERLATAAQQLEACRKPLLRAQEMVEALLASNHKSLHAWDLRLDGIDSMLESYSGGTDGYETLSDLQQTARSMKSSFRNNALSIQEKLDVFTARTNEIAAALSALEESKKRLESSRMDDEARETLRLASSRLSTSERQSLDHVREPTGEITQARLAIASAEALIEIKGN